jgi:ubiquinone/menaquinone biosynthesis C-methylase UbiE
MQIPKEDSLAEFEEHQEELFPFTRAYFGDKNLDVGCGNGVASFIQKQKLGIHPTLVDVVDIRNPVTRELPFFLIRNNKLPFPDQSFDSAYMQYVLHHIPTEDAAPLLKEVFRVAKRLILVEEVTCDKTDIEKATAFDEEVNSRIHVGAHMPVYHYYSPEEIEELCKSFSKAQKAHELIYEGAVDHGYLETHLFVIE